MRKRGQVSVFVVVGIVLLLLVASYLAYRFIVLEDLFEQRKQDIARLPSQFQPVASYLDACVQNIALDALAVVGAQGGYLDVPVDPIPTSPFAPVPRALDVLPTGELKVPLWFREAGNGIYELNVPQKEEVEASIASYVNENFPRCMDNLTTFFNEGYTLLGLGNEVETRVNMQPEFVDVYVEFPITLSVDNVEFTLTEYLGRVETQFGEMYDAAVEILENENEGFYLENKTLDMLVAYDNEVPFSGSDLSCGEKIWSKTQVTNRLKTILFENIAAMRVEGSNFDPSEEKSYLVLDLMDENRNVNINLMYNPSWPTLVEITPSEGDVLKSDPVTKQAGGYVASLISSYVCLNNHHFVYTIKYPLLVTLTDENGFTFQFVTEVIIDRNLPRENRIVPLDLSVSRSPLCEFASVPLKVNTFTVDGSSNVVPLDEVSLSFKCFPETCPLTTTLKGASSAQVLAPPCVNGFVEGTKQGYYTGKSIIATNRESGEVDLVLEKIYEKPVEIFVIEKRTGQVRAPYDSELISFEFRHNDARYSESFFSQKEGASCAEEVDCGPGLDCVSGECKTPNCESDDDCSLNQVCAAGSCTPKNTINLLPGEYTINSFISRTSTWPITTQTKTVENCVDTRTFFGLIGEEKCFTADIPSVELNNALVGGGTFEVVFNRAALASQESLKLYVLTDDIPADFEGFANIQTTLSTNKDHPFFRYPEI